MKNISEKKVGKGREEGRVGNCRVKEAVKNTCEEKNRTRRKERRQNVYTIDWSKVQRKWRRKRVQNKMKTQGR